MRATSSSAGAAPLLDILSADPMQTSAPPAALQSSSSQNPGSRTSPSSSSTSSAAALTSNTTASTATLQANGAAPSSSAAPTSSTSSLAPIAPAPPSFHHPHHPQAILHPAPLMPYPQHPPPGPPPSVHIPPPAQGQIVCTGCRTLLVYPNNASNVRCALCSTITPVPPSGTEMSQLVCGGCRTLLMYMRGASSVQCSCCHAVNMAMESLPLWSYIRGRPMPAWQSISPGPESGGAPSAVQPGGVGANQVAHIGCGGCGMTLMYAYGAQSVKCAVCQFVTSVAHMNPAPRMPLPMHQPVPPQQQPSASSGSGSRPQQGSSGKTIVVENPMSLDENGKLVSNVAVGVTSEKK